MNEPDLPKSNSQTSGSPPELNLGPELYTLTWPNKLLIDDPVTSGRFRIWRARSADEEDRWLRHAAASGDFYAMERLGLQLLEGNGTSAQEGLDWLKRSAESGSPTAMVLLAECLLDAGPSSPYSTADAEGWLVRAVRLEHTQAVLVLGTRLIIGAGIGPDSDRGKDLLKSAARSGSQLAHVKLAVYLLSGRGLTQDRAEGLQWLRQLGAVDANHFSILAYQIYMRSIAAATKSGARILAEEAAILFQEAIRLGNQEEEINLAYLLRRGEISASPYPSVEELLVGHVNREKPFALINQALRVAGGIGCTKDWHVADILVSKIRSADSIHAWWFARSNEGDAEGHLVTGWLVRHRLARDQERMRLEQRMNIARAGGWDVPDWMNRLAGSDTRH